MIEHYALRGSNKLFLVKNKGHYSWSGSPHLLKRRPTLPKSVIVSGQTVTDLEVVTFVTEESLPPGVLSKNGKYNHKCVMSHWHLFPAIREGKRVTIQIVKGETQMDISDV